MPSEVLLLSGGGGDGSGDGGSIEQLFTAASDGGSGYSRLFGQSASSYEYYYTSIY